MSTDFSIAKKRIVCWSKATRPVNQNQNQNTCTYLQYVFFFLHEQNANKKIYFKKVPEKSESFCHSFCL